MTPELSAYESIFRPINWASVSQRFEFSVPLFILSTRLALRWLIVLGQRVEQSLAVRWDEIEGAWWTVPREKFKGKKEFRVPLNDRAKEIMNRLEELDKDLPVKPEYLFHDGGGTKLLRDSSRAVKNNASTLQKGATPWWPRDIRRTVATGLGDLDERDDDIRHLVLGHARPTLSKTYIRDAKYDAPKRAMFLRWETDLNRILRGEPRVEATVTQLSGGAA